MRINGEEHNTLSDAARFFGVSPKTVRTWINERVIPQPPTLAYGRGDIDVFPKEYLDNAANILKQIRADKRKKRQRR